MRLEQENDDLAHELVTSKIALRKDLDNVRHIFTLSSGDKVLGLIPYWRLHWTGDTYSILYLGGIGFFPPCPHCRLMSMGNRTGD